MTTTAHIAALIREPARAFILRMEPTLDDQPITSEDWKAIECFVDIPDDWRDVTWWGRMKWEFGPGGLDEGHFRFNTAGLLVRLLLSEQQP